MAASAWRIYNLAKQYLWKADLDLDAGALRMKLLAGTKSAAVSDYARSTFASLTHITTNLKSPAVKTPGSISVSSGVSAKEMKFTHAAVVFTASGGTVTSIQYAVLGVSNGKALGWCKLSTAVFSLTSGNTLTITPNASGVFTLTGGTT
jgi:hypothetical protein